MRSLLEDVLEVPLELEALDDADPGIDVLGGGLLRPLVSGEASVGGLERGDGWKTVSAVMTPSYLPQLCLTNLPLVQRPLVERKLQLCL